MHAAESTEDSEVRSDDAGKQCLFLNAVNCSRLLPVQLKHSFKSSGLPVLQ